MPICSTGLQHPRWFYPLHPVIPDMNYSSETGRYLANSDFVARPKNQSGLSLVELLVAMAISTVIAIAAVSALIVSRQGFTTVDAASQLRDNARFATDLIQRLVSRRVTRTRPLRPRPVLHKTTQTLTPMSRGSITLSLVPRTPTTPPLPARPDQSEKAVTPWFCVSSQQRHFRVRACLMAQ